MTVKRDLFGELMDGIGSMEHQRTRESEIMKILHLDIETAPNKAYVWGLFGQNIGLNQIVESGYTMCWAAKWEGEKEIFFSSLNQESNEDMLQKIWELLDEADAVVHYNGEKFDIPTLNKEFLLLGWEPPSPYHHIDLLKTVRKRFRFTSNKLDYVAGQLGIGAKTKHNGMDLWHQCMLGDSKAWAIMERYNKQDVRLLPKLYKKLLPWIKNHPNHSLFMETDRPVCPNCGSHHVVKKGFETTLTMKYQRYKCTGCGLPIRGRTNISTKEEKANTLTASKL